MQKLNFTLTKEKTTIYNPISFLMHIHLIQIRSIILERKQQREIRTKILFLILLISLTFIKGRIIFIFRRILFAKRDK
jgi:hypothetical protein